MKNKCHILKWSRCNFISYMIKVIIELQHKFPIPIKRPHYYWNTIKSVVNTLNLITLCITEIKPISMCVFRWCIMKRNIDGHQFHQYQQNEQSPLILTEHKKDHDIWCWKSRSWLETGTKMWQTKPVNGVPTLRSW
jgi:hypothetical protein